MVPTQADFEHDLTARCREAVRATIQVVIDEELERLIGAGPYERNDQRVDVRNGTYPLGNVITTGDKNLIEAHVTATKHEVPLADAATVDMAKELGAIRALLLELNSEHAKKISRALDDADEEAANKTDPNKDELGKALDRALGYAKSATEFATVAQKLAPHVRAAAAWLGNTWTALLSHLQ